MVGTPHGSPWLVAFRGRIIVTEKRSMSADMAHRLARLFNTTPELWLGLQADVDLWKAAKAGEADYRKIKPLRRKGIIETARGSHHE